MPATIAISFHAHSKPRPLPSRPSLNVKKVCTKNCNNKPNKKILIPIFTPEDKRFITDAKHNNKNYEGNMLWNWKKRAIIVIAANTP